MLAMILSPILLSLDRAMTALMSLSVMEALVSHHDSGEHGEHGRHRDHQRDNRTTGGNLKKIMQINIGRFSKKNYLYLSGRLRNGDALVVLVQRIFKVDGEGSKSLSFHLNTRLHIMKTLS